MAPAPSKRRGQVPCLTLFQVPYERETKTRPAFKARSQVDPRDQAQASVIGQHPGCKEGQERIRGGPWTPLLSTCGSDTNIVPLGRAPEPLNHSAESKHSNQPGTLAGAARMRASKCGSPFSWSSCSAVCPAAVRSPWGQLLEKRN